MKNDTNQDDGGQADPKQGKVYWHDGFIESKKLPSNENVFLKNLRSTLTKKDLQDVIDAYSK